MLLSATIEYYLRPQIGLFLVNCPLHGAVSHAYSNMAVPVLDGGGAGTSASKTFIRITSEGS